MEKVISGLFNATETIEHNAETPDGSLVPSGFVWAATGIHEKLSCGREHAVRLLQKYTSGLHILKQPLTL